MKNFILKLFVIFSFCLALLFVISGFKGNPESKINKNYVRMLLPSASNPHTNFINAIFNAHYKPVEHMLHKSPWLGHIKDSLHFNSVQVYGGEQTDGSQRYGLFGQQLNSGQVANMKGLMDSVSGNQLNGIYGRINIEKMCYGQRLEYEVSNIGSTTLNDGFCYQTIMSNTHTTDGSRTVLKPVPGTHTAGILCQNIFENFQHTDLYDFVQNDAGTWFVKPVMKIDSSIVDTDPQKQIVKILITNYQGDTVNTIILRARNFRDANGNYNGNYIDKYRFDLNVDSLQVSGKRDDTLGLGYGISPNYWEWEANSKIDFKVEWLGQAEVWFDKMRVDDELANQVLNGDFNDRIDEEVNYFTGHFSNYAFFTDELVYSNIPCVKYVKDRMNSGSETPKFTFATSNYLNIRGLKNDNSEGYKRLLEEVQPDYFSNDAHLIPADFPNTMPHPTGSNIKYIDAMSPSNYNDTMQIKWGHKNLVRRGFTYPLDLPVEGSFVYQVHLARRHRDQFSPSTHFFMQPALHGWLHMNGTDIDGQREPMNSEIQTQAMLALAHGADGLFWFIMQSYGEPSAEPHVPRSESIDNARGEFYAGYGLLNPSLSNPTPRHSNMYNEDKWNYVRDMNKKLQAWKPYLDATRWDSGYSVHYEGAEHKYIFGIESIDPNNSTIINCIETDGPGLDCPEKSYWEMGFFYPDPEQAINSNDKSKYFLMANRRCIPEAGGYNGDYRRLKVRFKTSELDDFNNWKLIRLDEQNSVVATFDKANDPLIDCGIFNPGEGRLFKLAPVMQEGGTLVANEECSGEFDCTGEVNNNGKDIRLSPGTTISFTNTSARIKMTGGSFRSGLTEGENTAPVYLKGKGGGNFWKGLFLTGCDTVNMLHTYFRNISPYPQDSTYVADLINCKFIKIEAGNFESELDIKTGCIRASYVTNEDIEFSAHIKDNTFEIDDGGIPAVSFISTAARTLPLIIDGNDFTAYTSNSSSIALLLSSITGGVIKNNNIINYRNGILMLSSSMDIYHNNLSCDQSEFRSSVERLISVQCSKINWEGLTKSPVAIITELI